MGLINRFKNENSLYTFKEKFIGEILGYYNLRFSKYWRVTENTNLFSKLVYRGLSTTMSNLYAYKHYGDENEDTIYIGDKV